MRVLLDTNIFISYLLAPKSERPIIQIVQASVRGEFTLLLPSQLLTELANKTSAKEYLSQKIKPREFKKFVSLLTKVAVALPKITETLPAVTRDPKDDYLLAVALLGRADYLVTGDRDLLTLKKVGGLQILSPKEFAKKLDAS